MFNEKQLWQFEKLLRKADIAATLLHFEAAHADSWQQRFDSGVLSNELSRLSGELHGVYEAERFDKTPSKDRAFDIVEELNALHFNLSLKLLRDDGGSFATGTARAVAVLGGTMMQIYMGVHELYGSPVDQPITYFGGPLFGHDRPESHRGPTLSSNMMFFQIGGVTLTLSAQKVKEVLRAVDAGALAEGKVTVRGQDYPILNPAAKLGLELLHTGPTSFRDTETVSFLMVENEQSYGDKDRTSMLAIDSGKFWGFSYVGVGIPKPCDASNPFAPYAYEAWGEAPNQYVFIDLWAASGEAPERWEWESNAARIARGR
jgi:hypothetical protein